MTKFYYHTWTSSEDALLTKTMIEGEQNRKKVLALFNEAEQALQRTAKSCQNRWYEIREKQKAV